MAKFYAAEILEVLEYLREEKVVHRDLKPEVKIKKCNWCCLYLYLRKMSYKVLNQSS